MYKIGLEKGNWRAITDGNEIYEASEDVRYYSEPPEINKNSLEKFTNNSRDKNRIKKLEISPANFENYCISKGWEIRGCTTSDEKLMNITKPAIVGGALGAIIGGTSGAAIGAGIFGGLGWFSGGAEFNIESIISTISRAKKHTASWNQYDRELIKFQQQEKEKYLQNAKEEWKFFYKLRNISNLDGLTGSEFEAAIAGLYEYRGYSIKITKASGDYGIDIIAKKGIEVLAIQAKRYTNSVGISAVQEAASGALYYKATKAIVITNSFFTDQAKELATNIGVQLINKNHLADMWEGYQVNDSMPIFNIDEYEKIKSQIKTVLRQTNNTLGRL